MSEILVVGTDADSTVRLSRLLSAHGYEVTIALGFPRAVELLADRSPALVITALRLGEFNGIGLIIRSRIIRPHIRGIVLATAPDESMSREANNEGADFVVEPIDEHDLLTRVSTLIDQVIPRKWPRKQPADGLLAYIEQHPGRVLDLSYEGLRFEWHQQEVLPRQFAVTLPGAPLAFQARTVWTRRERTGALLCGAELHNPSGVVLDSWRRLVDLVPSRA